MRLATISRLHSIKLYPKVLMVSDEDGRDKPGTSPAMAENDMEISD